MKCQYQAENLETEIRQLETRIAEEKREAAKVEEVIENSVSGESRRGGEDKVLDDLEKVAQKIYENFFLFCFFLFFYFRWC